MCKTHFRPETLISISSANFETRLASRAPIAKDVNHELKSRDRPRCFITAVLEFFTIQLVFKYNQCKAKVAYIKPTMTENEFTPKITKEASRVEVGNRQTKGRGFETRQGGRAYASPFLSVPVSMCHGYG